MKPDATVIESVSIFPFPAIISDLMAELPTYIAKAEEINSDFCPITWWKSHSPTLPKWSAAASKILLLQPSSAAAERVFSTLNNTFCDRQNQSLKDYIIEKSVMLQYNRK